MLRSSTSQTLMGIQIPWRSWEMPILVQQNGSACPTWSRRVYTPAPGWWWSCGSVDHARIARHDQKPLNCGLCTGSIRITWGFVRNTNFSPLPQTSCMRNSEGGAQLSVLTNPSWWFRWPCSLSTNTLNHGFEPCLYIIISWALKKYQGFRLTPS